MVAQVAPVAQWCADAGIVLAFMEVAAAFAAGAAGTIIHREQRRAEEMEVNRRIACTELEQ